MDDNKVEDDNTGGNIFEMFHTVLCDLQLRYSLKAETKGDSWKDCTIQFLKDKLDEEWAEYTDADDYTELMDLTLVCLMLSVHVRAALLEGYKIMEEEKS